MFDSGMGLNRVKILFGQGNKVKDRERIAEVLVTTADPLSYPQGVS